MKGPPSRLLDTYLASSGETAYVLLLLHLLLEHPPAARDRFPHGTPQEVYDWNFVCRHIVFA